MFFRHIQPQAGDLKKIQNIFSDLSAKYAPHVKGISLSAAGDGSTQLDELVEMKETDKKSDFPISTGKDEVLSIPMVGISGEYPLTQASIKYLKVALNNFVKDELGAADAISTFTVMFMNEKNLATEFGKELRKIIQDIPFLRETFGLMKEDFSDENIKNITAKMFNYQQRRFDEKVDMYFSMHD